VEWLFEPASARFNGQPPCPPLLEDVNDWKQVVKFPDLDAIDWKSARERDEKLIDRNKLLVITILNGPFERLHALMGMINANCALLTDPEATAGVLMAIADYKVELIDKIVEYYPVDMFEVHDDWGHRKALLCRPKHGTRLSRPP
jgi:uroporphyrinogen decarboxylase